MNNKILKRQKRLFLLIAGMIGLGTFGVVLTASGSFKTTPQPQAKPQLDLPGDQVNAEELWRGRFEAEQQRMDQRVGYLEELLLEQKKQSAESNMENRQLRSQIGDLKQELRETREQRAIETLAAQTAPPEFLFTEDIARTVQPVVNAPLQELTMGNAASSFSNINSSIPSGATVRAVLVSSLDAPSGVTAVSNPHPVKLRVLDDAHLPKGVKAKLKGGIIIASAYGDISNERVYMRIERLTQLNADGDFVETDVTGFISGEDGRYGVRGVVVDKAKKMIAGAATSGVFSGLSKVLQAGAAGNPFDRRSTNVTSNVQLELAKQGWLEALVPLTCLPITTFSVLNRSSR